MRVRRTATSANSAATKKAFARTSRRTTNKRPVTAPAPRCDVTCSIAAESVWLRADSVDTLIASLAFIGALGLTAFSSLWTGPWNKQPTTTFLYAQVVFDLLLVTAAVHVTWDGSQSEFAPLYILVIAVS